MSTWSKQTGRYGRSKQTRKFTSSKPVEKEAEKEVCSSITLSTTSASMPLEPVLENVSSAASSSKSRRITGKLVKKTAVMSLVHKGTPPKLDAKSGHVYRVSPMAKEVSELNLHQVGIVKSFEESSTVPTFLHNKGVASYVNEFVTKMSHKYEATTMKLQGEIEMLKGEIEKLHQRTSTNEDITSTHEARLIINEDITSTHEARLISLEELAGLKSLGQGITIRRVVDEWEKSTRGKLVLQKIGKAVRAKYIGEGIEHRQFSNVLTEIKDVIQIRDREKSARILGAIEAAVAVMDLGSDDLKLGDVTGEPHGLIQIMEAYLGINKTVHHPLEKVELEEIVAQADSQHVGLEDGVKWLKHFANSLM